MAAPDALSAATILGRLVFPPARRLVRRPQVERRAVATLEADLYLPRRRPAPGAVLVLGTVREGRRYPILEAAAETVAARGFAVLVPELGRLRELIVDAAALEDVVEAARALTREDGVIDAPVGLIGFSLGASLALCAAADVRLRDRVACVAAMGGYYRLADMLASAAAGSLAPPSAFAVAASLVARLPQPDRAALENVLELNRETPIEAMAQVDESSFGPEAQRVLRALRGHDASAAASLIDAPALSPETVLDRISAPVWVLHDERDRYVPVRQFELMREAARSRRNFRFFETRLLEHTEPAAPVLRPVPLFRDYVPGLVSLYRFTKGPLGALRRGAISGRR